MSEEEAKEYLIGSNALGGDWDLSSLKEFEFDFLIEAGFDEIKLSEFWDEEEKVREDSFDQGESPEKSSKSTVKLGDIIHLCKHKILCGDSTKPENLKRLFDKERASMIYSDPVYNIDIDYDGGIGGNQSYGGEVNDTRTDTEYQKFIADSLLSALGVSCKDTHVFYWCDQIYIGLIQEVYKKCGLENKRVALWLKNNQNPVHKVAMNKAYEPCVYGLRGRPYLNPQMTSLNEVMNKEMGTGNELITQVDQFITDIWTAKRLPSKDYAHATSKPLTLHEKVIKRCTKPGDIILDSFLGSGSTLLAAEQLGRRVYGCELEPAFCDLIISRYESMTGVKAIIEHEEK